MGHRPATDLVVRRVRELQLQGDGVGLPHHQLVSPRVQLDAHVGITAGSRSVKALAELKVDVFFVNLKPATITASIIIIVLLSWTSLGIREM